MTSGNLYFRLLKEDLRRRIWAIALTFLSFFFVLPVGLALAMENAANTNYFVYNGYKNLIQDSSMSNSAFASALLELKTKVVLSQASFGNWMIVILLVGAAAVIGISGFSYLHNRRQTDFYHSIPVRREILYSAQYTGGILIVVLSYLINLGLAMGVAASYGVSPGSILGPVAGGLALNMLFFLIMYATVVTAMMMTGNLVVGIMASIVFFFFIPAMMLLLSAYCSTFFVTTTRDMWSSGGSPFMWGMKFLSPFSLYMTAMSWKTEQFVRHIPELICTGLGFLALTMLGLQLYRKRPSEAAGKAMAFRKTMAPIRMILVLGSGLAGGMLFWIMQSQLKWGLFGVLAAVILSHCVVEIIYHFDFKRLFDNKIHLAACLAAGVLVFLSFSFDWYGYDSYIPKPGQAASASLEIGADSNFLGYSVLKANDSGSFDMVQIEAYKDIEKNMKLTDMNLIMPIVEEGRRSTLKSRSELLRNNRRVMTGTVSRSDNSVMVVSGITRGDDNASDSRKYDTEVTVAYDLKNGRTVRRSYRLYLSDVMNAYEKLYGQKDYKTGLYSILTQKPEELSKADYAEAGTILYTAPRGSEQNELLAAYQADLMDLDIQTRMEENPIGSLYFVTSESVSLLNEARESLNSRGGFWDYSEEDANQEWPVYPSFTRTLGILKNQGINAGTTLLPENIQEVSMDVHDLLSAMNPDGGLIHGKSLADLEKKNPYYREDARLQITDPQDIKTLMKYTVEDYSRMNPFYQPGDQQLSCRLTLKNNAEASGFIQFNSGTRELEKFFAGFPPKQ